MADAKSPDVRLRHILREVDSVARAIGDKSFDDVFADYMLERTLERAIQIVSEAAKALPADLTARYTIIPWHAVVAIGNQLRHEYYRIKQDEIWEIATVHFPALRIVVVAMLTDLEDR